MNELLETIRAEQTGRVLDALTKMVEDVKLSVDARCKVATIELQIFHDLILSDVSSLSIAADESKVSKIVKSTDSRLEGGGRMGIR
jgi:hypothetical protein